MIASGRCKGDHVYVDDPDNCGDSESEEFRPILAGVWRETGEDERPQEEDVFGRRGGLLEEWVIT